MQEQVVKDLKEVTERVSVVEEGIRQYIKIIVNQSLGVKNDAYTTLKKETKLHVYNAAKDPKEVSIDKDVTLSKHGGKSTPEKPSESVQNNAMWKYMTVKEKIETIATSDKAIPQIELSDKDKEILRKLELEHEKNIKNNVANSISSSTIKKHEKERISSQTEPKERPKAKLSVKSKQSVRH